MNLKLEDKTALVSGSTAGIGFAIARSLAAEGTRVIVNGRTEARVSESMASIRRSHPHARLEPFVANLANAEAAIAAARRFPSIDILVNKPRCLRAEAIRTNQRQRLARDYRDELYERCAPVASLPAAHESGNLGSYHFHPRASDEQRRS